MNHTQLRFRGIMQDFGGLVRDYGRTGASPRKGSFEVVVEGM